MKQLLSRIFILTLIFNGYLTYASHVIGGEITYKHIKNNEYKINLKIYRDCNGCRINGYGGGSSLEDCSEIDYLYVRAKNSTTYKESKFSLTREKIVEISPICKSRVSGCKSNSNSLFGIEIHQFTTTVDLDDAAIKDMCNYYLYVSIAERNSNITTGQAEQLFCVDAFINTCLNAKNNSPDFITQPVFIVNSNKAQYQSFFTKDKDGDSLVYQLTSALASIDKEANYYSGFSNLSPLSVYCPDYPCTPDKSKEIGYYFDQTNGTAIFRPIKDGEQAVIVVKVSEYRKIKGVWELLGYTKRDLQVYVKTTDGNNSPKFINDNYFEICEEENFELKVETEDKINNFTNKLDSNYFNIISNISGATLVEYSQKSAPFNHAVFKWTPPSGASSNGIYTLVVMARDNNCPVFSESIQTFTIKVKPKEKLSISYNDLGCGNFEINTSEVVTTSKLLIQLFTLDKTK